MTDAGHDARRVPLGRQETGADRAICPKRPLSRLRERGRGEGALLGACPHPPLRGTFSHKWEKGRFMHRAICPKHSLSRLRERGRGEGALLGAGPHPPLRGTFSHKREKGRCHASRDLPQPIPSPACGRGNGLGALCASYGNQARRQSSRPSPASIQSRRTASRRASPAAARASASARCSRIAATQSRWRGLTRVTGRSIR